MEKDTLILKFAQSKLFGYLVVLLSLFMFVFLSTIAYWLLKDYHIIDWNISKFEMQKEEYRAGEPLTFRTAFCKRGHYEAELIYHVEDGVTYLLPRQVTKSDEGCQDFVSSTFITPNIEPGTYKITAIITYQVNPIRKVSYYMESNEFKIIQ